MTARIMPAAPLHPDDLVSRRPEEDAVEVGGRWVLIGVEQGDYVELNAIGVQIWSRIAEERSIAALAAEIAALYGAEVATVEADVSSFVAQLGVQKLVVVRRPE